MGNTLNKNHQQATQVKVSAKLTTEALQRQREQGNTRNQVALAAYYTNQALKAQQESGNSRNNNTKTGREK